MSNFNKSEYEYFLGLNKAFEILANLGVLDPLNTMWSVDGWALWESAKVTDVGVCGRSSLWDIIR